MGRESYQLGQSGEDLAASYLTKQGYRIVERNFRSHHGEIDIIAYDQQFLVFVEVKNYSCRSFGAPLSAITKSKREGIIHAAKVYLFRRKISGVNCRFDVLVIFRRKQDLAIVDLYKNAFTL